MTVAVSNIRGMISDEQEDLVKAWKVKNARYFLEIVVIYTKLADPCDDVYNRWAE